MAGMFRPKILDLIKEEHDRVKDLFNQFEGQVRSDQGQAEVTARQIITELEGHTQREEQLVYPRLRELNTDLFYEAEEEHHVADLLIRELKQGSPRDPSYEPKMMVLRTNVEHHMEEEEDKIFDQIGRLPEDMLDNLAAQWQSARSRAMSA